ncbi:monooxygenase [Capsulimonas corticalis]|uniref:Monooxygenase n=1 Tax=Capsulimonas corticalis TaxID=2219043 RepID=A0A402CV05_9BACT|nr:LLM class flavin-dependent oxidoreductase [Capsulimonas corticalis]BDI30261.1 monooxygenase [Capsulimonas corticalis]
MSQEKRQLHLNLFLMSVGHHAAAWRDPDAHIEEIFDLQYFKWIAQTAERAKLDSLFLADGLATWSTSKSSLQGGLEPFTLLSALAAVTEKIGLIGTVSTTYNAPFHVARRFASLDHLSGGRAGWNIVTSGNEREAQNFGREEHLQHAARYDKAREFLEVATSLWDSWDDDARIADKESGVYVDPDKIREIEHRGEWFSVRGPLNIPRSPQAYPLLVQAGSSEDGKEFAAQYAEAIFTAQQTFQEGRDFYADVKSRLPHYGRTPDDVKILPGISAVIAETESEALDKEAALHALVSPEQGIRQLSSILKVDLAEYPLDGPLPETPPIEEINGHKSRFQLVTDLAHRENLTIRQLIFRLAGGRGHRTFAGTPIQVADQLEEWFTGGAADGFNVMPATLPGGLEDFVNLVVPELQRRGLFRTEYTGNTLREHYGLARPANKFAGQPGISALEDREKFKLSEFN